MSIIKVMIVDDHQVVLDGFVARLELEHDIDVVATASNGMEAIQTLKQFQPEVVLMDVSMPIMNGLEAAEQIKQLYPNIKVLMLTMHDNREYIMKVMQSGAMGYMLKDISSDKLIQAIKTVYQGSTYFCESVTHTLFMPAVVTAEKTVNPLSRREETILTFVAKGESSKKIAKILNISDRTVETHRQNIKHKLDLYSIAELTKYAVDHGLL
ncbi:response regulator [Vibrio rumoiensis]|uniref:Response regulator n=1 Tax=Vibrio rumoiensis TaxID=76258 RepID=A0ABW7IV33_9VIBR|nr:response regulator transcription factor [Vibrio rumoiensis]